MVYGKNAVVVTYKISNKRSKTKLKLTPIMNFRDFHAEKHDDKFNFEETFENNILNVKFNEDYSANIFVKGATYQENKKCFYSMHYAIEKDRGFDSDENHYIPGTFEIEVKPNEDKKINFVCSLNGKYGLSDEELIKLDGDKNITSEINRIKKQITDSKLLLANKVKQNKLNYDFDESQEDKEIYKELIKKYMIASDNFVVYRNSNNMHSLVAGYPWFLDWGRDAFIAFEGLLLVLKSMKLLEMY